MKPQESLKEFSIRFFHPCFEFPERDVDWAYLIEKFQQLVFVSLQHLQFEINPDHYGCHDNPQVNNCLNSVPNIFFPISLIQEQLRASKEELTISNMSHPPPDFLPNGVLFEK